MASFATSDEDVAFCQAALAAEHSLGVAQPAGHRLWQIVRRVDDAQPVAILLWAASALHLKHRDEWIGWDGMRRSRRLGLIVNNSRFLILDGQRQGNLASKAMGAALRALPAQWREVAGFTPLLAEAFTDLESHHGTSYKASNWIPLGFTKGFGRHQADFYVPHDRPKKLWIYPLHAQAKELLCAAELPAEFHPAEVAARGVRSPLKLGEMRSLMDVFSQMTDPRRINSRRYSLPLMLMLVCMGLLCGATNLNSIVGDVKLLKQVQRRALGMRKRKGKEFYGVPCYNAFRELLNMLDIVEIQALLTQWLTQHEGQLPRTIAVDGKDLGKNLGIIVSMINTTYAGSGEKEGHEYDGTPTPPLSMKCEDNGQEMKLVNEMLEDTNVDLVGSLITGDALQCQHATLHTIVAKRGGDYMISLKDNQPKANAYAESQLEGSPFLT
jgi:Domain of unknown function (DUF4338)/DDE_Tnp_1-associated